MIETFFKDTAFTVRKTTASPTGSDTSVTSSSFTGLLRPVDDVSKLYVANNIGKEFDFVVDDSVSVSVGDFLYVNSVQYKVLGQSLYEDLEDSSDSYINVRISR